MTWKKLTSIDERTEIDNILRNIDRYTQIDDILKAQLRQIALTNSLLIALVESGGGQIPEVTATAADIMERFGMGDDYETLITEWKNETITGNRIGFFEAKGSGVISELVIMSDVALAANGVYKIEIIADGNVIYNDTYANFAIISDYYQDVTAFADADYYACNFNTIYYYKNIKINIVGSTATFTRILLKRIQQVR